MATYYVIRTENNGMGYIVATLTTKPGEITYLPIVRDTVEYAISVMDDRHVKALMDNLELTPSEALAALSLADVSVASQQAIVIAPEGIGELSQTIEGSYHVMLTIGDYRVWQVTAPVDNLILLHNVLWAMSPAETLGAVGIVQTFGNTFYPAVVKNALNWDNATWLARRNLIATYISNHGGDGAAVSAATTEDALCKGIATGMGYTVSQLWAAMD